MPSPIEVVNAAQLAHEVNRLFCLSHGDTSQQSWFAAPLWQRESATKGVQFIVDNPHATPEMLHDAWTKAKIEDGWRYGEKKDALAKTHPCLVNYAMLPFEQRLKDDLFQTVVRAMLRMPFIPD